MAKEFTDSNFQQEVLKIAGVVVVDFWASWCGPCKMIAPIVEELAKEYEGKVIIGKLNVDDNPNTASSFGVRSIPTLLIFKNGQVQEQIIGAQPKEAIKSRIESVLNK